MKNIRLFTLFVMLVLLTVMVNAQQEYTLYGGGACTFSYLKYSPNNQSSKYKPIIIQLCNSHEDIHQSFENDSLRRIPDFRDYYFYYIPNRGNSSKEKLQCLRSISNSVTFSTDASIKDFLKDNLFLYIKDTTISREDIITSGLNSIFANIQLATNINKTEKDSIDRFENQPDKGFSYLSAEFKQNKTKKIAEKKSPSYDGPAKSYNFTLSGIVKDGQTGESLPFATVQVKGTSIGASTNTDGYFTIHKVPTDTSTLVFNYVGYDKTQIKLSPLVPKSNLVVEIEPRSISLQEVVIADKREEIMQINTTEISTIKMTPGKLEQLPNITLSLKLR